MPKRAADTSSEKSRPCRSRNTTGRSRTSPRSRTRATKRSRESPGPQMPSSIAVRPMASSRGQPDKATKASLTIT